MTGPVSTEPLIAVFIDYENLARGVHETKVSAVQIDLVLRRLLEMGRIVYKRAYCDWSQFRDAGRELHTHGVVMVDIPRSRVSGKNSADIHMVVDAMDLCHAKEHIGVFALLSGDSDFTPLVGKLKECDKRVIGCGVKSSTSNLLVASCDEFLYYDDLVRAAKPRAAARAARKSGEAERPEDVIEQLMEIVRSLARDYENVWASMVKQTILRVHPGFNPEAQGYASFAALLKAAERKGFLKLEPDPARGNYRIHVVED
ncbi:MAG: NYN domain-containing protein [Deltaproteobacteria bacterium]|nr:NYN domain-containing protein [Deltaproteobacteria bacterium]